MMGRAVMSKISPWEVFESYTYAGSVLSLLLSSQTCCAGYLVECERLGRLPVVGLGVADLQQRTQAERSCVDADSSQAHSYLALPDIHVHNRVPSICFLFAVQWPASHHDLHYRRVSGSPNRLDTGIAGPSQTPWTSFLLCQRPNTFTRGRTLCIRESGTWRSMRA